MTKIEEFASHELLPEARPDDEVVMIASADLGQHAPTAHALVYDDRGRLSARASWWTTSTPPFQDHRVGVIGHYAAADDASALQLLAHATTRLRESQCTMAIGPMDGNTWRDYRFVIDRGTEPPFFLEPHNPEPWPRHFERAGFSILARYSSALNDDLSRDDPSIGKATSTLERDGIRLRTFEPARADSELRHVYELSRVSFTKNFLYTPLSEAEFLDHYRRALPLIRPELVYFAERDNHLVGFLFTIPDLLEAERGQPVRTIILKTIAVSPDVAGQGLGSLMMAKAQRDASTLGFRRAIHALMHDDNVSRRISQRTARTIRRYALFAKPL